MFQREELLIKKSNLSIYRYIQTHVTQVIQVTLLALLPPTKKLKKCKKKKGKKSLKIKKWSLKLQKKIYTFIIKTNLTKHLVSNQVSD